MSADETMMRYLIGWATFAFTYGLPFTLYVAVQPFARVSLRGQARQWSALAIPFMAWLVWATVGAFREDSNLWPIGLIVLSPVALLYLGLVFLIARTASASRQA